MMDVSTRRKLLANYRRNETQNYHTRNAVMLIHEFGNPQEIVEADQKYDEFKKRGFQTPEDSDWFYKKGHSHYPKLL
jgi:hypothetical protein